MIKYTIRWMTTTSYTGLAIFLGRCKVGKIVYSPCDEHPKTPFFCYMELTGIKPFKYYAPTEDQAKKKVKKHIDFWIKQLELYCDE